MQSPLQSVPGRILGLILCLFLGWMPASAAEPASKAPATESFGRLSHPKNKRAAMNLTALPKKWHRVLRRRLDGLQDESEKTRRTSLGKLTETLAHQAKLAAGPRARSQKGPGPAEVARYIEYQIVKELGKNRGAWAIGARVERVLDTAEKENIRFTALDLLVQSKHKDASTLLLVASNRGDEKLKAKARIAMAHWPREELDLHLAQGFANDPQHRGWQELIAHRVGSHGALNAKAGALLIPALREMVVAEDWKVAGQALWIAKGLSKERHAEFLVTSIASVAAGVEDGKVRWRILSDMASELREISGRSFGLDPRPWQAWYQRVLAGEVELDVRDEEAPRSSVEFFGIGRVSKHVTFVIDGSGSMDSVWGTGGSTYYEEAVRQLVAYLDNMGDGTYFRVVLFSSDAKEMVSLQKVEEGTTDSVRSTMLKRKPNGGTALGAGVELALDRNARDEKRNKTGSSDAFIVLCDGATMEGSRWAEDLIASEDFPLGLRFHCVQLGRSPAGAMEALAEGTGGRFVRVRP
ncbi:MAG: VWA domain-containing protein [Planctomycetota bacterium]|nr:VWA domain-containing protein [Planctomycetota bacterium]